MFSLNVNYHGLYFLPVPRSKVYGEGLEASTPALGFCPSWIMAGILDHPGSHNIQGKETNQSLSGGEGRAGSLDGRATVM